MNLIAAAKESIRIAKEKKYSIDGVENALPDKDYSRVIVITPEDGASLVSADRSGRESEKPCKVSVTTESSFEAAERYNVPFVMNFANAHVPGGGFLLGARAQEEALCRCSTLYTSIASDSAKEMYHYNNTHISSTESDYMLLSPDVCVFRDNDLNFLEKPFMAAVITAPAPNRRGAAFAESKKNIEEVFRRRIRIILAAAVEYGYKDLVLGAWGCGAFGNSPEMVSGVFRELLVDEGFIKYFDNICFAVYGRTDGRNYKAFADMLKEFPWEYL